MPTVAYQVNAPALDEELSGRRSFEISWTSLLDSVPGYHDGHVKISYSINGGPSGGTYTAISESEPNSGSYSWVVTNINAPQVYVRVETAGTPSQFADSSPCSITRQPVRYLDAARAVRDYLNGLTLNSDLEFTAAVTLDPQLDQKPETDTLRVLVCPDARINTIFSRGSHEDRISLDIYIVERLPESAMPRADIDTWADDDIDWIEDRFALAEFLCRKFRVGLALTPGSFTVVEAAKIDPSYDKVRIRELRLFASGIQVTVREIVAN